MARRRRAKHLSFRGRATLAVLGVLCLVGVGSASISTLRAATPLPPVAAPPPPLPAAPPWVFERFPVEPERLEARNADRFGSSLLAETVPAPPGSGLRGPLLIEYSLHPELTRRVVRTLRRARVRRGHAIALDPATGRVLAWVSTEPSAFPPERAYPAASLVKVVTAAAALEHEPKRARAPCRYAGNPYRLRRHQVHRPRRGREVSLGGALALSNNHCFAQLAVETLGAAPLLEALGRFGWLEAPAPGHEKGVADAGDDDFDLGRLGCGLAGCRITPLHAAGLGTILSHGRRIEPWWVHRVIDGDGRSLPVTPVGPGERVISPELAGELREMLVRTTRRGTARSAFRDRRGRARLPGIAVAGKTGNLTGGEPRGRYEWFVGLAPAEEPRVAVVVVQLHDDLWWQNSSSVAAAVLEDVFCEGRRRCAPELAERFTGRLTADVTPALLQDGH